MADALELDTEEGQRSYAGEAIEVLSQQRSGTLLAEFGEELADIVRAIRERGKGTGKVTLTLDVRAATKGGGRAVSIAGTVKAVHPKAEVEETLMYAGHDGRLSRRDPAQPELPFKSE